MAISKNGIRRAGALHRRVPLLIHILTIKLGNSVVQLQTRRPLRVKNGSVGASKLCLRYPTKQTSTPATATSVSCQRQTHAPQQLTPSFETSPAGEMSVADYLRIFRGNMILNSVN